MSAIPKNARDCQRRLDALREEYLRVRGKNENRAKAVAKEIYALQELQVANGWGKKGS
ncbi:hypothetical protein SEA_PINKIEPIE_29 [Streptomyces phage PinkiePie]|nr:hypothetical protein SEA_BARTHOLOMUNE_29 [Streptomyces phage Bartholomune]UOW93462.1 hypothetical protein SEA_SQUILLIUM_29 [Streptomyces phage Squillium]WNM73294.1 hypothetical protein SEA_LIANDRY_29 [Streptomyces phage Liandry]WNM74692.1 hypothetical protein SEA_PINKIEPIE_29 [Streptomyces phage PinkiePie]